MFASASPRSTTLVEVKMTSKLSELGINRGKVAPMTAHIAFPQKVA